MKRKSVAEVLCEVSPGLTFIPGGPRRKKEEMDFHRFGCLRRSLIDLRHLSSFADDPLFEVNVDGDLPLRERIRAPSRIVLEHGLYRAGVDKFRISGPQASA